MLYIHHATIFTPHRRIDDGALLIEDAHIAAVGTVDEVAPPPGSRAIDATGLVLVPGFIDLQINGGFGHDFTADPTTIWSVARRLPRYGVTSFLPTIITSPPETLTAAQNVLEQPPPADYAGAIPLGLHIEGPFLNPKKKGAHNPAYLRLPQLAAADGWSSVRRVRLVTLAPELPGALDVIAALVERGIVVGVGHSMATYAEARAGFEAGARYGTHLFNAMPPLRHREPGLIGALLTEPRATVGLIVDGIHVHPAVVNLVWRAVGGARLNLVTDAMAALGMPPGRFLLGELEVIVDETGARLPDGTLAGSILSLDAAVWNLMRFTGCSLGEALPTVTTTPAALLGLSDQIGRLIPGSAADLVLLTPDFNVVMTIVHGNPVYINSETFNWTQGI